MKELESYIVEHQHLPNMTSSQVLVDEGGIELKKMMVKQQEKIEELTLSVLDLQKQIESLKN